MKKITEAKIAQIITNVLKENMNNQNPFSELDNEARQKAVMIENQIEALQNQVNVLMRIGDICIEVDKEIKMQFQGIQGPIKEKYSYSYTFPQPLQYNEETYKYGNIDENFEEDIKNMFPEEIRDAVNVYSKEKNDVLFGFELWIDIDDIEGWH